MKLHTAMQRSFDLKLAAIALLTSSITCAFAAQPLQAQDDASSVKNSTTMVIVVGAAGLPEYQDTFSSSALLIEETALRANIECHIVGATNQFDALDASNQQEASDYSLLESLIAEGREKTQGEFWLIFLGHGTFDGKVAKFNLRGPDVTAEEIAKWTADYPRTLVAVNCSSSSAPFINALSGKNRIVVTSTRSGFEQNLSRFGAFFSKALASPEADLDKDDQTSLLESFLFASQRVAEYYESESRLQTEHSLIDDNGDQRGTPSDWFVGIRVEKQSTDNAIPDGLRAHQIHLILSPAELALSEEQRRIRNDLELQLEELRLKKSELGEERYFQRLDSIVSQLAQLYDDAEEWGFYVPRVKTPEAGVMPPRPISISDIE